MKILAVITSIRKASGATSFCCGLANQLARLGHQVTIAIMAEAMSEEWHVLESSVNVIAIDDLVRGTDTYDIAHVHGIWNPPIHHACVWLRSRGIPYVISPHGSLAPWAMGHHAWKKWVAWYLWFRRDMLKAAAIHVTAESEEGWLAKFGLGLDQSVVLAPLGTNRPAAREEGGQGDEPCRGGEGKNGERVNNPAVNLNLQPQPTPSLDRRAMAEKKVSEWLDGVDAATFEAALDKLVEEKTAAGEYRFKRTEERALAISGARQFYCEFSRKIIPLSDGRYVYFAPDQRSRSRNASNAISWAEYAFHAVSSSGKLLDGKNFRERIYNATKVADLPVLESVIRSEQCMYRLIDAYPENDAVIFVGHDAESGRLEVVTRLDQFGNAEANLGEVTVIAKHKRKETPPPKFRPLTEVVEAVAKHQAAGFSPSTTKNSIANPPSPRKGGNENSAVDLHLQPTPKQQRTLLFVGRVYPVKALDNLIRAFALAIRQSDNQTIRQSNNPSWRLRLVGPDQSGHMSELMSLCDQLGLAYTKPGKYNTIVQPSTFNLQPQIQFIGPKYDAELSAEYDACDALALVSHTENFGATIVDALAHGKPVITSTKTPWREVVDEQCGWWVDNDPKILSKAIAELIALTDEQRGAMGANGKALVARKYTWEAIANTMLESYRSAMRQ